MRSKIKGTNAELNQLKKRQTALLNKSKTLEKKIKELIASEGGKINETKAKRKAKEFLYGKPHPGKVTSHLNDFMFKNKIACVADLLKKYNYSFLRKNVLKERNYKRFLINLIKHNAFHLLRINS
jgi:hypothetical protein